jgi:hypothetical protein
VRFNVFLLQRLSLEPSASNIHITADILFRITIWGRSIASLGTASQIVEMTHGPVDVHMVAHHWSSRNNVTGFLPGGRHRQHRREDGERTQVGAAAQGGHEAIRGGHVKEGAAEAQSRVLDRDDEGRREEGRAGGRMSFFATARSFIEQGGKAL